MSSQGKAGSTTELADRVKAILASRQLSLHQASQKSARLFGRSSPYYLPHNLYYDLSHGHFSPSLYQLVALSNISNYRLRDWLRVFGFDIEAIPRLQIQLASKRTSLLDSSLDDPNSRVPWFRNVGTEIPSLEVVPLSRLVGWTGPHRLGPLLERNDKGSFYIKVGSEDALAFPEVFPGSIVRVNPGTISEALMRITEEGSANLFLLQHAKGFCCCHLRAAGPGRVVTISTRLSYAQMEFRIPEEARIIGVADLEIRSLVGPKLPSVAKSLAKRWKPDLLPPEPSQLGPLLRQARLKIGLSFRAAASISRDVANALGDERYFTAAGSLSDYETLTTPPRHFHKIITFCAVYSLRVDAVLRTLGLRLEGTGQEPIPDLLTGKPVSEPEMTVGEVDRDEATGFMRTLLTELGEAPLFLRRSLTALSGLPKPSLKDVFWIGGTLRTFHPVLAGGILAVVNRQKKKPNECGSKPAWQQPLYIVLKRDGTYLCGCCSRENTSLVVHTYTGGVHNQEQFSIRDAEIIGKIAAVARRL